MSYHHPMSDLLERYSPEVILQAEERRKKLAYHRLKVGPKISPRVQRILGLLYQAHQNYYLAHFEASCILSSVLFEQAVLSSLERELEKNHPISFKVRGQIYSVTRREDLVGYSLLHLVGSAVFHGLIPKSHAPLAHQIRFFRNLLMHQGLPHMEDQADCYRASYEVEMDNGFRETRSVEISHREVAEYCLGNGSEEIWAYYLLMRVRELMAEMFEEKG